MDDKLQFFFDSDKPWSKRADEITYILVWEDKMRVTCTRGRDLPLTAENWAAAQQWSLITGRGIDVRREQRLYFVPDVSYEEVIKWIYEGR